MTTGAVLDRFEAGLKEAGHDVEVADLYAERFNPVSGTLDNAFFADDSVPDEMLVRMQVRERASRSAGGPLRRAIARRWLGNKSPRELARIVRQQERVRAADVLAFIAPVYWLGFPAILQGWIERAFTYGFAYRLTPSGWHGDVRGRIPLLHHKKVLLISTTFFSQADDERGLRDAMELLIDSWGVRYPGIHTVEHTYFWAVAAVEPEKRQGYLDEAGRLGRTFAN